MSPTSVRLPQRSEADDTAPALTPAQLNALHRAYQLILAAAASARQAAAAAQQAAPPPPQPVPPPRTRTRPVRSRQGGRT